MSKIAETGLSLSCVRHFFIMDDVNSIPSYQQIRARAVRYQSHIFLPQDERNVKVYIAVVAPPKGI